MDKHDDIVARLRSTGGLDARLLCDAADEIERLRKERNEAEPLLNELWERRTEATEMRSEIERLRKELRAWQDAHRAHPDEFGGNPE